MPNNDSNDSELSTFRAAELEISMAQQYDTEYLKQAIDDEIKLGLLDKNLRGRRPATV